MDYFVNFISNHILLSLPVTLMQLCLFFRG